MKKALLLLALLLSFNIQAALIELNLRTPSTFNISETDDNLGLVSNGQSAPIPRVTHTNTIRINENTTVNQEESVSGSAGLFTQRSTSTTYASFSFNNFTPFFDVFNEFTPIDLTAGLGEFTLLDNRLDLNIFFNDEAAPGFEGGDVSIRFGQFYELFRTEMNQDVRELIILSGRVFFDSIRSIEEYNQTRTSTLSEVLRTQDISFVQYSISHSISLGDVFCDSGCFNPSSSVNRSALSFGTGQVVSISEVPEPSIFLLFGLTLFFTFYTSSNKADSTASSLRFFKNQIARPLC